MALILFGMFILLLVLGVPVGFSICSAAGVTLFAGLGDAKMMMLAQRMFVSCDSFSLIAVPFFIFAGDLLAGGKISKVLVEFCESLLGMIKGGLSVVSVLAGMFFAAISGSGAATTAAVGATLVPELKKRGYKEDQAAALIAAAGTIGVVIPPSIPMVMYSVATGASVGALFMGGVIPGLLIGISLMGYSLVYCKKRGYINRESEPFSWGNVGRAFKDGIWALLVPVIILGGIYGGIFTPTEAAAVAVAYGLCVGLFIYRDLKVTDLFRIFTNASLTTATVMIILGTANTFGRILTLQRVPTMIGDLFTSISNSPYVILMLVNILLLIVGTFMETNAAIIILAPIFCPMLEKMGVDPVHLGVIMVVNLAIGFITPPLGVNLFVACNVANTTLGKICKAIVPIIIVMVVDLLIITYIEPVVMLLPNLIY